MPNMLLTFFVIFLSTQFAIFSPKNAQNHTSCCVSAIYKHCKQLLKGCTFWHFGYL